jgi:hypothetical protein
MIEDCYRRLFAAILTQAIEDATAYVRQNAKLSDKLIPTRARDFLFEPNEMFDLACAVTDNDPDVVRSRARRLIAEAQARHAKGQTRRSQRRPQRQVRRRTEPLYELNGESLTLHQWADRYSIDRKLVGKRVLRGWDLHRALTELPSMRSRRSSKSFQSCRLSIVAPGEGQDLAPQLGTGGGSDAQERAKTEFPAQKEIEPCL